MKTLIAIAATLCLTPAFAADAPEPAAQAAGTHRYLIERTFPPGALAGLDAAAKAKVNATNAHFGVHWVTSYANAEQTKTYCIYEGPSETAVRQAATANNIPVDAVVEVPVMLSPN
jgi:predicted dinucleotide-utilizing enzyme